MRLCFGQFGVDFATAGTAWPSVFDRFKHIGKELTYRTVYAALCSQSHNDAEDLLNALVAGTVDEGRHWDRQMIEDEQFALYMVLLSLRSLIEASAIALTRFLPVAEDFRPLIQTSLAQMETIIQQPPMCDWT